MDSAADENLDLSFGLSLTEENLSHEYVERVLGVPRSVGVQR